MVTNVMKIIVVILLGIVTAGMVGTIGFKILGGIQATNTAGTYEANVTANMQEFGENTTSQLPLLGTITGLVFLFGAIALIGVFGARKTGLM